MGRDEIIRRCIAKHGTEAFDYSGIAADAQGATCKIEVKCKTCQTVFRPTASAHYNIGTSCPTCKTKEAAKAKTISFGDFVVKADKKHKGRYKYPEQEITSHGKMSIECNLHGVFKQNHREHSRGTGCPKCGVDKSAKLAKERAKKSRMSPSEFIKRASAKHNNKYTYDSNSFTTTKHKVRVHCKKHGWFEQDAASHLYRGEGCPECSKGRLSPSQIKKQAIEKHGSKFDYSLIIDNLSLGSKITVICPSHGKFNAVLKTHLNGKDCPDCEKDRRALERTKKQAEREKQLAKNREARRKKAEADFIRQATEVHEGRYTYGNFKYEIGNKYAVITCSKHGDFKQQMQAHIRKGRGCPECGAEESCGWSKESYVEMCRIRSKGLSTLYAVTMTSGSELFFKIGITHKTVKERFANKEDAPYDVKELYTVTDDVSYIYDLEKRLHKLLKKHNYQPNQKFGGHTECFASIKPIEKLLKDLSSTEQIQLIA